MDSQAYRQDELPGIAEAVREALRPDMVRVAPGRHAWVPAPHMAGRVPGCVLCRWERIPEGVGVTSPSSSPPAPTPTQNATAPGWRPVPIGGRFSRVRSELVSLLGFNTGADAQKYETLLRLARAGFIDMVKVSPGCWLLDVDSWHRHLLRCMENPEMWDEGSPDLEEYRFANGLGRKAK